MADIGADHAYLPIFLIKTGACPFAYAVDVSEGSCKKAAANIVRAGLTEQIQVIRGDGLSVFSEREKPEDFVFAGMGGRKMISILEKTAWIKNPRYRLILSPNTSIDELRQWLCQNRFTVLAEHSVSAKGRLYTIMTAAFKCENEFSHDKIGLSTNFALQAKDG